MMIEQEKRSKRDARQRKLQLKELEDLRKGEEAMKRSHREQKGESDDQHDDAYINQKGRQWWKRFDDRNFPSLHISQYRELREQTTSRYLLQIQPKDIPMPGSYYQLQVLPFYDLLAEADLVHVLFKTQGPTPRLLASYTPDPSAQSKQACEPVLGFKVSPQSLTPNNQSSPPFKLTLAGYNDDQQAYRILSQYKRRVDRFKGSPLQKQIKLWEKELDAVNDENHKGWKKVLRSIQMHSQNEGEKVREEQITEIRDFLTWSTVLKCFLLGLADKTQSQLTQLLESQRTLKPAKSKENAKKFFETDCKICFCSANQDSNQVLYCDNCNTSFHLACYGLSSLPPEDPYFCDPCQSLRKIKSKPLSCQLCCRSGFPMKQIQGHFYHLTCLILLNLVIIRKGSLVLRDKSHQQILQMVVNSELGCSECEHCGKNKGIRLECRIQGCRMSAHPICAYLNGCTFQMQKLDQRLMSTFTCKHHDSSRDWVEQTYLRRYMCNLNQTSQLSLPVFREKYQQEISKVCQDKQIKSTSEKIIEKTKFLKRRLVKQQPARVQSREKGGQISKMLHKLKYQK